MSKHKVNQAVMIRKAPTGAPEAPTGAPEAPTGAPEAPTGAPEAPTGAPEAPTGAPEAPTGAPEAPTGAPEAPTGAPEAPTGSQDAPTGSQDAPKKIPTLAEIKAAAKKLTDQLDALNKQKETLEKAGETAEKETLDKLDKHLPEFKKLFKECGVKGKISVSVSGDSLTFEYIKEKEKKDRKKREKKGKANNGKHLNADLKNLLDQGIDKVKKNPKPKTKGNVLISGETEFCNQVLAEYLTIFKLNGCYNSVLLQNASGKLLNENHASHCATFIENGGVMDQILDSVGKKGMKLYKKADDLE